MSKYQNKYRIETARSKEWDYSNPCWYYVTINTKNHIHYFGSVINEKMELYQLGKIAKSYWENIPKHFTNVDLDYYVIMPNHLNGIIIINAIVETPDRASLRPPTLGQIINQYKGSVKHWANLNGTQTLYGNPDFMTG